MHHRISVLLSFFVLTTACTENMTAQDNNPKTCEDHSCAKWTTCIIDENNTPQCVADTDGDEIADTDDICPYTPHQDAKNCFYVIDGVYHIYAAQNLMILHDMKDIQSVQTIEFERDINMADLQLNEKQDTCFVTDWDNKKLSLSGITLKGNHHIISSVLNKSNKRCSLPNALFDKIENATISKLTLDYDVEDMDSDRLQAFALLANTVDGSKLNDIMYSGKVVSNSKATIHAINKDLSDGITAVGGLAGICQNSTINDCFSKHTSVIADYAMGVGGMFGYSSDNTIYVTNPNANCDDNLFVLDNIQGGLGVGGLFGISSNTSINDFPGGPSDEIACGKYFSIIFDTIQGMGVGGLTGITLSKDKSGDDTKEKNYLGYILLSGNKIIRQFTLLNDVLTRYSEDDDEYTSLSILFTLLGGSGGWIGTSAAGQTIVEHSAMHVSDLLSTVSNPNNVPIQTVSSPIGGFIGSVYSEVVLDSIVSSIDTLHGNYNTFTGGFLGSIQLNSGFSFFGSSSNDAHVQLSKITSSIDLIEGFDRSGIVLSDETLIDDDDYLTSGLFNATRQSIIHLDHVSNTAHIRSYGLQDSNYAGLFVIDKPTDNMDFNFTFKSVMTATNRYLNSKSVSNHAVSQVLPSDLTCKTSTPDDAPLDNSDCLKGIYYYANHAEDEAFSIDAPTFSVEKVYGSQADDIVHDLNRELSKAHDCQDICRDWYWKKNAFRDDVNMQSIDLPYLYQPELEDALLSLSKKHCQIFNNSPFCTSKTSE